MKDDREDKKSPIKTVPLRDAGQSLSEEIDKLLYDRALMWIMLGAFGIGGAATKWARWWFNTPPQGDCDVQPKKAVSVLQGAGL